MTQPAQRVKLVLNLDRTTDPISGTLDPGDAPPRTFDGWLELSALLEQTRRPPPSRQASTPAEPDRV